MVVLKQSGAGPGLVHCHVTLTLEVFMTSTVTLEGAGGPGGDRTNTYLLCKMLHCKCLPLAGMDTILKTLVL